MLSYNQVIQYGTYIVFFAWICVINIIPSAFNKWKIETIQYHKDWTQ